MKAEYISYGSDKDKTITTYNAIMGTTSNATFEYISLGYIKIGNIVFITSRFNITNAGTVGDYLVIRLPNLGNNYIVTYSGAIGFVTIGTNYNIAPLRTNNYTGGINALDWNSGAEYLDLAYNTVQAGYALVAYDRFVAGKTFVFECSDVKVPIYHYGGKATCAKKAVCEACGKDYGEKDPKNHTGNTVYKNIKAATFTAIFIAAYLSELRTFIIISVGVIPIELIRVLKVEAA